MRVRMARAPQPGVNASSHAVGAEDDFGSSGGWTRTSLDSPTDCILVNDADAQEAAGAEGRSDDAAAAVVRLRSALGIPANPDAPSAAALSRLFDLEMLAFHRMARALMRTLLPAPAEADALLPPLAPGGRSYTDVLVAIGAPTPAAILGCPRLLPQRAAARCPPHPAPSRIPPPAPHLCHPPPCSSSRPPVQLTCGSCLIGTPTSTRRRRFARTGAPPQASRRLSPPSAWPAARCCVPARPAASGTASVRSRVTPAPSAPRAPASFSWCINVK
jgi:hypothetical protein